jgi:ubiquinone/menaquinone biosynthesis C-methylase UbiE
MTRNQLYRRVNLLRAERVLDVGCGTGAITQELARRTQGQVIGLDINPDAIAFAQEQDDRSWYEMGDALDLPYPDDHFDVVTCHFVLLWVSDPVRAAREIVRVARRGGWVLACAEPDYGGRLDWPDLPIRAWQIEGLRRQGADPLIGRQLRHILVTAGLRAEVGVIPSQWGARALAENLEAEWKWLQYDVGDAVDASTFAQAKTQAKAAIEAGTRLVYLPIFYALGKK